MEKQKINKHGKFLGLALAAILFGGPSVALAQTVISESDLSSAITNMNTAPGSAYVIDFQNNIQTNPVSNSLPYFYLYGGVSPTTFLGTQFDNSLTFNGHGNSIMADSLSPNSSPLFRIINAIADININDLNIKGGRLINATSLTGNYYAGAGLYIGAVNHTIDLDGTNKLDPGNEGKSFSIANLNNMSISDNKIELLLTNGENNVSASGGGLFIDASDYNVASIAAGEVNLTNIRASNNSIKIEAATPGLLDDFTTSIQGGGIRVKNATNLNFTNGLVENNRIENINGGVAHGGGMSFDDESVSGQITGVSFKNNLARVAGNQKSDGSVASAARGGALFLINENSSGTNSSNLIVENSSFSGNTAQAVDNNLAQGGAFAMMGKGTAAFENTIFDANKATSNTGANSMALGGAIYAGNFGDEVPEITLKNSRLINNQANSDQGKAFGGAIYMDTAGSVPLGSSIILNLEADLGQELIISGNTANGQADGIYFGSNNGTSAFASGILNINAAGTVKLLDPVTVDMGGKDFTFNASGPNHSGTLYWNSQNVLNAGAGSDANVLLNNAPGVTVFGNSYTVNAGGATEGNLNINIDDANILFDASRSSGLAVFDMAKSNTGNLSANGNTTIGILNADQGSRQILDFSGQYLLATDDSSATNGVIFTDIADNTIDIRGTGVSAFEHLGTSLYATVNYSNPEQAKIKAASANSWSGRYALQEYVNSSFISNEDFQLIRNNYGAVTAEYGMIASQVSLGSTQATFERARQSGLNGYFSTRKGEAVPSSAGGYYGFDHTFRAWAGYIGNFQDVGNKNRYLGYDSATHGGLIGVNFDASEHYTVGIFGGSTKTNTELNKIKSEVDTDGTHVGLIAAWAPVGEYPAFGLYFDLGYSYYKNDGYRKVGANKIKAKFDQDVYTVGVGAEHIFNINDGLLLTPFLNLRYSHISQDEFKEKGYLTASRVKAYNADSFTSDLGIKISHAFKLKCGGSITPYINTSWKHEYGDRDMTTKSAYVNPNGGLMSQSFDLSGVSTDRDALNLGTGGEFIFLTPNGGQVGFNVDYNFQTSKNQNSHSIYTGLLYRF